jgi:ABC-type bacteriocin/lantibiotic exporter with double-glycine peptidase domain
MVLASFGYEISEAELCQLCDCTYDGVTALQAVDAIRQLGFLNTAKHNLTLAELQPLIEAGLFPIAFLDMTPINGSYQSHAVVVTDINPFSVEVLDPAQGALLIARDVFDFAWSQRRRLTILIQL